MAIPEYYPLAQKRMLGEAEGSWSGKGKWKLCLHTTETEGVPDYDSDNDATTGELAPHLTYYAAKRTWVQDYKLTRPSESLRTYDNDHVFQVEIICYSAKSIADAKASRLYVGNLSENNYLDLVTFTKWLMKYVPIQAVWPGKQATSYAQANAAGFRYSAPAFYNFNGILGHQHVPANTHWDPGAFNWKKYIALLKEDEEVPLTDAEIARIWKYPVIRAAGPIPVIQELADIKTMLIAEGLEDEEASVASVIAAAVVKAVTPLIAAANKTVIQEAVRTELANLKLQSF